MKCTPSHTHTHSCKSAVTLYWRRAKMKCTLGHLQRGWVEMFNKMVYKERQIETEVDEENQSGEDAHLQMPAGSTCRCSGRCLCPWCWTGCRCGWGCWSVQLCHWSARHGGWIRDSSRRISVKSSAAGACIHNLHCVGQLHLLAAPTGNKWWLPENSLNLNFSKIV